MVFVQEKFALQHMLTGYRKVFMMKLLTITVPSYNSEAYLDRCMATLLPGGDEVEILIVDDGSTDRTAEIADEYEKLISRCLIFCAVLSKKIMSLIC